MPELLLLLLLLPELPLPELLLPELLLPELMLQWKAIMPFKSDSSERSPGSFPDRSLSTFPNAPRLGDCMAGWLAE